MKRKKAENGCSTRAGSEKLSTNLISVLHKGHAVTFSANFIIQGLTHAFQQQKCNAAYFALFGKNRTIIDSNLTHTPVGKPVSVVYRGKLHKLVWSSLTSLECCAPSRGGHTTRWMESDIHWYKRRRASGPRLETKEGTNGVIYSLHEGKCTRNN
jgi:hypothetical protein